MRYFVVAILLCLNFLGISQTGDQFNQINSNYEDFKSRLFFETFLEDHSSQKVFGELPQEKLPFSETTLIGINHPGATNNKFNAALLSAISNSPNYEFVADQYDGFKKSNSLAMKELLRIEINKFPVLSKMELTSSKKLNELEEINTYSSVTWEKLDNPISVIFFISTQESRDGLEKNRKVIISRGDSILYEATKKSASTTICFENSIRDMGETYFNYQSKNKEVGVKGGLWAFILFKHLENINNKVYSNSTFIKQVNDNHSSLNKDLKRSISKGNLAPTFTNILTFWEREFEKTQTLEGDFNEEQIVTWYAPRHKKSVVHLTNRIKNGLHQEWAKNGNLTLEVNYINGLKEGELVENYEDLTPKTRAFYKNGVPDKKYLSYHENGNPEKIYYYKNSMKHGKFKEFYSDGSLKFKGKYKKNQPKGWHIFYDIKGRKTKKIWYWNGVPKITRNY